MFDTKLPSNLVHWILEKLDLKTLISCMRVSRRCRDQVDSDAELWKLLIIREGWFERFILHSSCHDSGDHEDAKMYRLLIDSDAELEAPMLPETNGCFNKRIFAYYYRLRRNWFQGSYTSIAFGNAGDGGLVVTGLLIHRDRIISATDGRDIVIYDIRSGDVRMKLAGHEGGVWCIDICGNKLVTGSTDRTVRLWDLSDGKCLQVFTGHSSTVRCLSFVPWVDELRIVSGSRDSTICVWTAGRQKFYKLAGHTDAIRAIVGHGNIVVSGSYDRTARVWDLLQMKCLHVLEGHTNKVYSVQYDHESNQAFSSGMDGTIRVWCTRTGSCLRILDGHSSLVAAVKCLNSIVVSASADTLIKVWNPENSSSAMFTLRGHSSAVTALQVDCDKIVSGSEGGVKLWHCDREAFARDILEGAETVWKVAISERYCVCAISIRGEFVSYRVMDFSTKS